jgi:hypothetical protein
MNMLDDLVVVRDAGLSGNGAGTYLQRQDERRRPPRGNKRSSLGEVSPKITAIT